MPENSYSVYIHTFPNGKRYIGMTMMDPKKRWNGGSGYRKQPKVMNAIRHFGWENISHEVVASGLSREAAEEMEVHLIAEMDAIRSGYNIDHGGPTKGTHSEETRKKISDGNKGKKKPPVPESVRMAQSQRFMGEKNPFFGRRHKQETKDKHSRFMAGNDYFKGKHHSEEFKRMKSGQMAEKYKDGKNPRCKRVVGIGETVKEYAGLRIAAKAESVSLARMFSAVKNRHPLNGYVWRYKDE